MAAKGPGLVRWALFAALVLLALPAQAQSDDPCLDQLASDPDALDQYDALVADYLDASAASDATRQVEILDQLIGVCDANLRLRVFRANANVARSRCEDALVDYRYVLEHADGWPARDNGADAQALARDRMARYEDACGPVAPATEDPPPTTTVQAPQSELDAPTATVEPEGSDSGLSLVLGVNLFGGAGWGQLKDEGGIEDPTVDESVGDEFLLGFGGSAQLFATVQIVPAFGVGLDFVVGYWTHEDTDAGITYSGALPSIGPMVRVQLPSFVANAWLNYFFGTIDAESDGVTREFDVEGVEVGVMLGYPIHLGQSTAIEIGGFAQFYRGTAKLDLEELFASAEATLTMLHVGLAAQATFDIGL